MVTPTCGCTFFILRSPDTLKIEWCPLHANAEATLKQRDQLLEIVRPIMPAALLQDILDGAAAQPAAETTDGHLHQWVQCHHARCYNWNRGHVCEACTTCDQYRCELEPDWQPQKQEDARESQAQER